MHHVAPTITRIHSRDNPLAKSLRRLSQESNAYRKQGQLWLEGDHLCRAALARGWQVKQAVFAETFWSHAFSQYENVVPRIAVFADSLFAEISALPSPAAMGFVVDFPTPAPIAPHVNTVILDRVQDAGNVGSILRSAAAFGFAQVIALQGTASLYGHKVLRAGMGAHFGLNLIEGATLHDLDQLSVPLLATSSHHGKLLHQAQLPVPCAWIIGHEGQGVCNDIMVRANRIVRIHQPGGEESLNVAAAAAICLHATSLEMNPHNVD